MTESLPPPDANACWEPAPGSWALAAPLTQMWLAAAINRTVGTLPRLHPWRLGDAKGNSRLIQWTARAADPTAPAPTPPVTPGGVGGGLPDGGIALAALTVTARDPELAAGDDQPGLPAGELSTWATRADPPPLLLGGASGLLTQAAGSLLASVAGDLGSTTTRQLQGPPPRWAGAVTRIPGTWLPPMAVLSRALRGVDDPGTSWQTESWDFDQRLTVHADEREYAANVLAPHVMAIVLDTVPQGAAVTLAGDALHVWWPYRTDFVNRPALVATTVKATLALASAIPDFVFADHPDHSDHVQGELDAQTAAAHAYQEQRRPGHSPDPVMQHMYDAARAAAGLPPAP
jgi:hypothetical protein